MFDMFKPPRVRMRKRIPAHALLAFDAVDSYAQMQLADLPEVRREQAVSFVLAVWAGNSALTGAFQLSQHDLALLQNTGVTGLKMLPEAMQKRAAAVVEDLVGKGVIPFAE
jgi:hypothetical protein